MCSPEGLAGGGASNSETISSISSKVYLSSSSISSMPTKREATSSPNSSLIIPSFSSKGFSLISKF